MSLSCSQAAPPPLHLTWDRAQAQAEPPCSPVTPSSTGARPTGSCPSQETWGAWDPRPPLGYGPGGPPGPSQGRQGTSSALFTFLCLQSRAERLGRKCRLSGGQPSLSHGPSPLAGRKASAGQPGPGRAGQTDGQAQEGLGQTDGWHSLGRVLSPLGWVAARG